MYKEVLLAIDGSENSRRAAEEALHLADDKTRITLLHVTDPDDNQGDVVRSTNERAWNKQKKDEVSSIIALFDRENVGHKYLTRRGLPAKEIIKEAELEDYELVVIGSRGLSRFQEMVLGSVSHKVAKRAEIPVMIVK